MKKNIIKKIILTMGILVLVGGLSTACTQKNDAPKEQGAHKLSIVTTIFPPYDFAKSIALDKADISMMIPPGAESHSFEPTAQDIMKIQNADLFIYIGGHGDTWVDDILDSMGDKKPKTLKLMDSIDLLPEEDGHDHDHDHEGEHKDEHGHEAEHKGEVTHMDEHIWTSPKNAMVLATKIADEIISLDKANESFYAANKASYIEELTKLDNEFKDVVKNGKRKTIIIGDRFPLKYFVEEYGLKYYAAFSGCGGESEPSASEMATIVKIIKSEKIPVVMYIEFSNQKIANALAESTKVKTMLYHSCHNVSQDEIDKGATYLSIMKNNINTIKEALN